MPIYSIWESQFPAPLAAEGRVATEAIWRDMPCFEGYLSHELLVDADDPGHLLVVSQWASREHADESLRRYAEHPNAPREQPGRRASASHRRHQRGGLS